MNRTRNLLIWSQTRYHCATDPLMIESSLLQIRSLTFESKAKLLQRNPNPILHWLFHLLWYGVFVHFLVSTILIPLLFSFSMFSCTCNGTQLDSAVTFSFFPGNPSSSFLLILSGNCSLPCFSTF